ncbi:MAG TPA: DUF1501 domain-containing protein, partial [Holophagaceae bacterium]|nr:DUF1501 domain-containing protein [Holophagaceae bacterium]
GMPGPTLSHFSAKDLWAQSGVLNGTGWLGRFADTAFVAGGDPLRGIVTTPDVPTMFKGSTRSFASIPASTGFVFPSTLSLGKVGAPYAAQALEDAWGLSLATVGTDPVSLAAHTAVRAASKAFFDGQNAFGTDGTLPYRGPSVTYPGGSLSAQLILIAQMIATGIPGQVYGARLGGFDTHGDQAGVLPGLLRESGGALKAFWDDLAAIPVGTGTAQDKVLILVWSEFGRRIRENDGGTDHGTAGLAFCIGKSLTGGFYGGGYPNLADPDVNGNMKATTDFRSLHATVLERHLGAAATTTNTILGANYPRLSFL